MMIILSPSKGQAFDHPAPVTTHTLPDHLVQSKKLIGELKKMKVPDLQRLMSVSEKIAALNVKRYRDFSTPFTPRNAKQALFAFMGDVYSQIPASSYSKADLTYAQNHLRILSGLYGTLRPLDLIQPYRLEMKTKLKTTIGDNLYQFWGERITDSLNMGLEALKDPVLVNLASAEYFEAIDESAIDARIITPVFKDLKNGRYKFLSFYAKKARGLMARYIIENRVSTLKGLKDLDVAGYYYSESQSRGDNWVFLRDKPG